MNLVLKHIENVALDTIIIPNIGRNSVKDRDEIATFPKRRRNTTTRLKPLYAGNIIHYDITHGTGSTIGGVKYALLIID